MEIDPSEPPPLYLENSINFIFFIFDPVPKEGDLRIIQTINDPVQYSVTLGCTNPTLGLQIISASI